MKIVLAVERKSLGKNFETDINEYVHLVERVFVLLNAMYLEVVKSRSLMVKNCSYFEA